MSLTLCNPYNFCPVLRVRRCISFGTWLVSGIDLSVLPDPIHQIRVDSLLESIFELMGIDLAVPDHSTLSQQFSQLEVVLLIVLKQGARHGVVDSTGVKVYGEGEWETRQHGISKRRTWCKLHLGVDEATGEILAAVVTTNDVHDGEVLNDILE